ncbi:MAG: transporter ATP-binding protein [Bacteroidetes bacterium]|jgi:ABC-2 type transport system ATP-binding protein|nr:transporter ATP-binding protein [Bacteroidota bacterium]
MNPGSAAIAIDGLTKVYKGNSKPALNNISLTIDRGHIFGLLGPNGAGKTTMIRILCGLLSATSGEVFINGLPVKEKLREIRRIIGVVPQEIALYPSLTAYENLSVYGGICGLKGKNFKLRLEELLPVFGLEKSLHSRVDRFSGGMKRRLNLMVGMLPNPLILFLDEPTVGVDVQSKKVILENLVSTNQSGTTIIYTSHYLEEAENLCTDIAILDEGQIISRGSPEHIRNSGDSPASLEEIFLALTGKEVRD